MTRLLARTRQNALAACALSMAIGFGAHVQARDQSQAADVAPMPTSYLQQAPAQVTPGVKVIGQGEHAWRFVVRHPERPTQPYRHAAYQVRLPDGLKLANGDTAVMGKTDAQGRTDIIRVQADSKASDWVVLPALGKGPSGTVVFYRDGQDSGMADIPYVLEVDTGPIYCGVSLPSGHSAYLMVTPPQGILQRQMASQAECMALQRTLNPIVARAELAARLSGIRRLMADPAWADHHELLSDKLQALVLKEGRQSDIEQHVRAQVYEEWGISKAEQAERLNGIAYSLLTTQPARFVPLASQLIDQSVALHATPYNLDTQGWARHHLGRHEEALALYAQALQAFQAECQADTQGMYLETLAHQAETLWVMGRHKEAIALWADVQRNDARNGNAGSWSNGLTHWKEAQPAIKARVDLLDAQGSTVMPDCSETREPN